MTPQPDPIPVVPKPEPLRDPPPRGDDETAGDVALDSVAHWLDAWLAARVPANLPIVGGSKRKSLAILVLALGMVCCQLGYHPLHGPAAAMLEVATRAAGGAGAGTANAAPTPYDVPGLR